MRQTTVARCGVAFVLATCGDLSAQDAKMVKVAEIAWSSLSAPERAAMSDRFLVNVVPSDTAGVIIDAQTINESTPGTSAGSQIGAAYGSALYTDRAFRGPAYNYSATRDVSATLLGAIIGGMADQRPQAQFHARYTIRTLDGQIRYHDEVKADAFRHSIGICISLVGLQPIDQAVCTQTADALRKRYLAQSVASDSPPAPTIPTPLSAVAPPPDGLVMCKFGNSAPVLTDRALCERAQGELR